MHSIAVAHVILDRLDAAELRNSRPSGRNSRPGRLRIWLARRLVSAATQLARWRARTVHLVFTRVLGGHRA